MTLRQLIAEHWTQNDRLLRLTTPLGANQLLVESWHGSESLSDGFNFQINTLSTDAHLSLKSLIGQPALLELLTAHSRTELRPFHGHITRIEALGANGGLARYRLTLEPWTAFLSYNRDSAIYQDMTVFDILDSLFQSYAGQGKLTPKWRYDLADPGVYPKRSLTTQYQESDAEFIQRLLAEDGLFSWFEHEGDAHSPSLGSHTLVIADHNEAFQPNPQSDIEFAQPGSVIKEDRIDRWRVQHHWRSQSVSLQSWDYRTLSSRPVTATSNIDNAIESPGHYDDTLGVYAYNSRTHGQRLADRMQEALDAHQQDISAEGSVRTLSPGTTFTLHGHAGNPGKVLIWHVEHHGHNNLSADLQTLWEQNLGLPTLANIEDSGFANHPNADLSGNSDALKGQRTLYRNRLRVIPASIPYRNPRFDEYGQLLHRKPTVFGQQTAIVVGPPGQVIHTDRDHRIKVQFHWQRGDRSHNRLPSTRPGHSGAPASEQSGTWVRVMTSLAPIAGANWGSHSIPRIGQEVLIDFLESDIDRPIVIAGLYNGQGQLNAQHNQISQGSGASTGNAQAWFPGQQEGHAHPASLSGFKSQAMSHSQSGTGAYNQFVFDDSPGESRTSLQHHASVHQGTAELNLGHLRHQSDNQRLNKTGFGVELKTPHSAAIRAGQGLLISTDARLQANSSQLDSREALAQVQQSQQLQQSLTQTAQQHHARLKHEPQAKDVPAIKQELHSIAVLASTESGRSAQGADMTSYSPAEGTLGNSAQTGGGEGQVTAYSEPHLQFSSPAGIIASTPKDAILSAGNTSSLTASHDINLASQGNHHHWVKHGISLFTYGKAENSQKPNTETGIKLHAATGKVSIQSQSDKTQITADQTLTVASTQQSITIAAPKHLLMTAQGAYLKLEGGNIMIHGPGQMAFKAGLKELAGPGSNPPNLPSLPKPTKLISAMEPLFSQQFDLSHLAYNEELGFSSENLPYQVFDKNGTFLDSGTTNKDGLTDRILTNAPTDLVVLVGKGSWQVEEHFEDDDWEEDDSGDGASKKRDSA